nr:hypothetical protein [Tanacetum cinerariifolium]
FKGLTSGIKAIWRTLHKKNICLYTVKRKEKEDNAVLRYQALKRKPQTKAQARKNMIVYLKNMACFRMEFFKGMRYDDIRSIFEKYFNSIVGFLEKGEEQLEKEASRALKRKSKSSEQQAAKKQKFDEEMILLVEIRYHLTRFTLDQMLNNMRLEVEEESEVSLELLRFVRRHQQEGYRPDFGVNAAMVIKEKHQVFTSANKDISAARQKLMMLVTAAK